MKLPLKICPQSDGKYANVRDASGQRVAIDLSPEGAELVVISVNAHGQLIATLIQARIALEHSTPKVGQYAEPMTRHISARCAIDTALEAVGMKRFNVYNATSETDIGFYYGATAADALDMLGQSKGYKDYATFLAQHGLSPLYNNLQITEVK